MYGITEEEMPTPTPASSATGSPTTPIASRPPIGVTTTAAMTASSSASATASA